MYIFLKPIFIFFLGVLAGALLNEFVFPPIFKSIKIFIFGEPRIVFNLTELRPATSIKNLENFTLLFGSVNGMGLLVLAQIGHKDLNKEYGMTPVPTKPIGLKNHTEYSFILKNTGTGKAKNITINLNSLFDIKIPEMEKSDNIYFINYGGFVDNYSCLIKIKELKIGEIANFTAYTREPGIRNIECLVNGDNTLCYKNYRHFYVANVFPGLVFEMNGKKIQFPLINQSNNFIQYYYSPQEDKWKILPQQKQQKLE